MPNDTFQVNVNCASGQTQCSNLPVQSKRGTSITINWNAAGNNSFPASGFFSWKSGSSSPGTLPTRSGDGKTLTLNYSMPTTSVTWSYNITLNGCATLDPDIENQVDPTPDPDEPPQGGGGGGQPGGGQPGGGKPGGGQPGGGGNPGGGNPSDRD